MIDITDTQLVADTTAALIAGRERLNIRNETLNKTISGLCGVLADSEHYLFLKDPDDLASFCGCGTAEEGVQIMVMDTKTYRLYEIPIEECPNCKDDEEEPEDIEDDEPTFASRWLRDL